MIIIISGEKKIYVPEGYTERVTRLKCDYNIWVLEKKIEVEIEKKIEVEIEEVVDNLCLLTIDDDSMPLIDEVLVVIKSKDRLETFGKKTYTKILKEYGFEDNLTYIFVSDEKDYVEYKEKYPELNIILGDKGIVGIDNFIVNYFAEGQKYIYMNDDVSGVYKCLDSKTKVKVEDLKGLMNDIFLEMENRKFTMGGLYPVPNPYFMAGFKDDIRYDLVLIMDPVSCCINNKEVILTEIICPDGFVGNKTDHEKCILHYKSKGGLVRFNKYCADVEYYNKSGGYRGRTKETEKYCAEYIKAKYPEYISNVKYKKDGGTSLTYKKQK